MTSNHRLVIITLDLSVYQNFPSQTLLNLCKKIVISIFNLFKIRSKVEVDIRGQMFGIDRKGLATRNVNM